MYSVREHNRSLSLVARALFLSLILHLGAVLYLVKVPLTYDSTPLVVDVVLAPPQEIAREVAPSTPAQIVSEPDRTEEVPPPDSAKYRAERDSAAQKEQVRRGTDPLAGRSVSPVRERPGENQSAAGAKAPSERKAEKRTEQEPQSGPIRQLALDESVLLREFGEVPKKESKQGGSRIERAPLAGYQAFSRPSGSGAAFLGTRGVTDYLPSLPDGDITLLNAKADQFAVFVRRVASQVFGQLRASGWERLRPQDVGGIGQFSEVRAVLSLKGELLRIEQSGASGSDRFDAVLHDSVKRGVRDPNPPEGAVAADGNIHFIFRAKSWVQFGGSARNGAPVERRWLLLATGLE